MKNVKIFLIILIIIFVIFFIVFLNNKVNENSEYNETEVIENMKITSPAFKEGGKIPSKYTCDDANINPELHFEQVPENAKSLVLIMEDPDAPVGLWVHWVVFNIPSTTKIVPENSEPQGTPGKGTNKRTGYMGPCPPDKEHRYFFKLYALDTNLNLPAGSTKDQVENAMKGHVLAQAQLMGKYVRSH